MERYQLTKGLDIPISGEPVQTIRDGNRVRRVALLGDDYIGMKPTMLVQPGDQVKVGQKLFTDKKNEGVVFTSPGCGTVLSVNRGAKRKFESLVIDISGDDELSFCEPGTGLKTHEPEKIREILVNSGLWTSFRTRPYGKNPAVTSHPTSLFITAMDSSPLAANPQIIIKEKPDEYRAGLKILRRLLTVPIHYCAGREELEQCEKLDDIHYHLFKGPHPAGLVSTHIHFIDPVHEGKVVWHIDYQEVTAIGHLFLTGRLMTERIVSLAGPGVIDPSLVRSRVGASLNQLLWRELSLEDLRVISGSILSGRQATDNYSYLGRYHDQISVIEDSTGRSIFNWALPGLKRFSSRPVFASSYIKNRLENKFNFNTALWGGKRAIYPLGTYDEVMPMDIIATSLLKSISVCDTEKSKELGCLELIEEDLGLCGFVCPGKNEFGPVLRNVLTEIEKGN